MSLDCQCVTVESDGYCAFEHRKIVRARKAHKCEECRKQIEVGEQYQYIVGRYEDDFGDTRTCLICAELRDALMCGGFYGDLWEELEQGLFPRITTGCYEKLTTAAAKAEIRRRWWQWKEQQITEAKR